MRGVIGVLFLLIGFTVAYLVLTGNLPAQTSTSSTPGSSPGPVSQPTGTPSTHGPSREWTTPLGLPTMQNLSDQAASLGGMK